MRTLLNNSVSLVPAGAYSGLDCPRVFAELSRPFRKGEGFSVNGDKPVSSGVIGLLGRCSPAAVIGAVITVIVDTVKACAFGPFAHVLVKRRKGVEPSVADFNASASVPVVFGETGVGAAAFHAFPCGVGTTTSKPVFLPLDNAIGDTAPAANSMTRSNVLAWVGFHAAAIASALPFGASMLVVLGSLYDGKASESLAAEVDDFHGIAPIVKEVL